MMITKCIRGPRGEAIASIVIIINLYVEMYVEKKTALQSIDYKAVCGETEIRTRDTLLEYTRFPGVPLKPLEHLSGLKSRKNGTTNIETIFCFAKKS